MRPLDVITENRGTSFVGVWTRVLSSMAPALFVTLGLLTVPCAASASPATAEQMQQLTDSTGRLRPGYQELLKQPETINTLQREAPSLGSRLTGTLMQGEFIPRASRFLGAAGLVVAGSYEVCSLLRGTGCFQARTKVEPTAAGFYPANQPTRVRLVNGMMQVMNWRPDIGDWSGYWTDRTSGAEPCREQGGYEPTRSPSVACLPAVTDMARSDEVQFMSYGSSSSPWYFASKCEQSTCYYASYIPPTPPPGWTFSQSGVWANWWGEQRSVWSIWRPLSDAITITRTPADDPSIPNVPNDTGPSTDWTRGVAEALAASPTGADEAEWLKYAADPQSESDPTTEEEEEARRCRPASSVPTGDPGADRGTGDYLENPAEWAARYEKPTEYAYAGTTTGGYVPETGLDATGGKVYMRWGYARLDTSRPENDWTGWGFRKIVAKHGWGPEALARTKDALLSAYTINPLQPRNAVYVSADPYSGLNGVTCKWKVVVQRTPIEEPERPEASTSKPLDSIISAHGFIAAP